MRYRFKLMLVFTLLVTLSFSIGGTVLLTVSQQAALDTETETALTAFENARNTLALLGSAGNRPNSKAAVQVLDQLMAQNRPDWQSLSLEEGTQNLYASGYGWSAPAELTLPEAGKAAYLRVRDEIGPGLLVQGLVPMGEQTPVLRIRFDSTALYQTQSAQRRLFGLVYAVIVGFALLGAAVLSQALTRPLKRLTVATRRITGGNLGTRSRINSRDEFGQLSRDFDAMADKLQENFGRLESEMQHQEQFMGAFAHELKTPMTSIIGFADLLRQGDLDENTRLQAAGHIYSEGKRLEALSFKLLDLLLLKKDTVTFRRVRLDRFIQDVSRALTPVLRSRDIRLVCRGEARTVLLEPDLCKSLVYNLIDNAAKAMDGEGVIALSGVAIPGGCQFQVADNGRGMEPSELSKITEAFYRVDKSRSRAQGGAGLGLALCKQIVELHNGTIAFDSAPGRGTRVTVSLYGEEQKK